MVRNEIFRSDFMLVTKSCIAMHPDKLTSSFYIHLKAENSLYLRNSKIIVIQIAEVELLAFKVRPNLKIKNKCIERNYSQSNASIYSVLDLLDSP